MGPILLPRPLTREVMNTSTCISAYCPSSAFHFFYNVYQGNAAFGSLASLPVSFAWHLMSLVTPILFVPHLKPIGILQEKHELTREQNTHAAAITVANSVNTALLTLKFRSIPVCVWYSSHFMLAKLLLTIYVLISDEGIQLHTLLQIQARIISRCINTVYLESVADLLLISRIHIILMSVCVFRVRTISCLSEYRHENQLDGSLAFPFAYEISEM